MKKLFLIAGLLTLSMAQAKEYKVFDVTAHFARADMTSATFGINPELGRSWVEVTVHRDDEIGDDFYRVKVPGLSYDAQFESINIENEGQIVECARIVTKGRWIFKQKVVELTERCRFDKRQVTLPVDNGFEIKQQKRLQVYLIVE